MIRKELGVGYCGLVCALCSENTECVGCKARGCENVDNCKCFMCCTSKHYDSCADCSEFPCEDSILIKQRIRTFCKFRKEYGEETLIQCLLENEKKGIHYHYENELVGDYDACEDEKEIYERLIRKIPV